MDQDDVGMVLDSHLGGLKTVAGVAQDAEFALAVEGFEKARGGTGQQFGYDYRCLFHSRCM